MNARAATIAQMIQVRRNLGLKLRIRKNVPRSIYPAAIEREYRKRLFEIIDRVRQAFKPLFDRMPTLLGTSRQELQRLDVGEGREIHALAEIIVESTKIRPDEAERLASEFARRTSIWQKGQLQHQIKSVLGLDLLIKDVSLATRMDGFVSENVALIKNLPSQVAFGIEQALTRAVQNGTLWNDLAEELEDVFQVGENRAKRIARDQVGKFYGELASIRQQELGCTEFIWRTVRDVRVRDEHRRYEGNKYQYNKPPSGQRPGVPINCRCYPEPVFDDILKTLT